MNEDEQKSICGRAALAGAIEAIRAKSDQELGTIALIRFEVEKEYDLAGDLSATNKIDAFLAAGFTVRYLPLRLSTPSSEFAELVRGLEDDYLVSSFVIQNPIPTIFANEVRRLQSCKELDGHPFRNRRFSYPATAEVVIDIIEEHGSPGDAVCVVGGNGFVGKAVVDALRANKRILKVVDRGDDVSVAQNFQIVVSAVGIPRLIGKNDVSPGSIAIDCGQSVVSTDPLVVVGDFCSETRANARIVTPVPGGVGPLSLVKLLQRACSTSVAGEC